MKDQQYDDGFPEDVQIFWTGDAVCQPISVGTLDKFRNYSNTGSEPRRVPLFWLNWPVNDINNARMLLGKGSLLHGDVEPANLAGVVTNPMQEAENLDLTVKGIRIIATEAKENIWLGIKDIIINGGETDKGQKSSSGSLFVPETFLVYTGHSGREAQVFDQNEDTYIWYKIQGDNCKKDDYIGLDLGEVYPIGEVRFVMPSGDNTGNDGGNHTNDNTQNGIGQGGNGNSSQSRLREMSPTIQ